MKKTGKKANVKIGAVLANALMNDAHALKIPWYRRGFKALSSLFTRTVSRSKYQRHQGTREKARRLRQIAAGTLKSF